MLKNNNERKISLNEFDFVQQNFHKIPFHDLRKHLKINESTLNRWIREIFQPKFWSLQWDNLEQIIRHRLFLVQLDNFIYIVEFDEPIFAEKIRFCPIKLGIDYEVSILSNYEFNKLKNDVLIFKITASNNYVYDFWYTTQYFLK